MIKRETHLYRILDKIGFYILLILNSSQKLVTRNGIINLTRTVFGENFHHSAFTLRLEEYEKRGLIRAEMEAYNIGRIYGITDKGRKVLRHALDMLEEIEPGVWNPKIRDAEEKIRAITRESKA